MTARTLLNSSADPARYGRKDDGLAGRDLLVRASHGELVLKEDGEPGRIGGYGSVFNAVDSYGETVMPGAFAKSLKGWRKLKRPIPMLWQHRSDQPIGIWDEFEEDSKGLLLGGKINLKTQRGQEAHSDIEMKAVTGLSIGFYEVKADPWDWTSAEPRKLIELDLRETSPVTFPALKEAQIDAVKARLARGERLTVREFEGLLREKCRLSRSDAEEIATHGYKAWLQRDAGPGGGPDLADDLRALRAGLSPLVLPDL